MSTFAANLRKEPAFKLSIGRVLVGAGVLLAVGITVLVLALAGGSAASHASSHGGVAGNHGIPAYSTSQHSIGAVP